MEKVYKRESFSAEETFAIGKELAAQAKPGEVYCLYGDLGCGKTVFSQGFGAGLGEGANQQPDIYDIKGI